LLGYMVRSWRLLLLAVMNTMVSVATSFALLAFASNVRSGWRRRRRRGTPGRRAEPG
jgi:hypothetical protein